jgi:hypothetical protein
MAQSSKWSLLLTSAHQNPLTPLLSPIMFHMTCPSHSSWFDHPNNISWEVQIMNLLINGYKSLSKNHHRYLHNNPILAHQHIPMHRTHLATPLYHKPPAHHYLIWMYGQNLGAFKQSKRCKNHMGIGPSCKMDVWAKLNEGIILLHDIAHVDHVKIWEVFKLPVHSPNARPCNFLTFGQLKKVLKFTSDDNQHYKLGDMFLFIEPSSGQFLRHIPKFIVLIINICCVLTE